MSSVIDSIERRQLRTVPPFQAGDRLRVHFQVVEGSRSRVQVFEGVVIKRQGHGARETFTVRKQSFGVGVERTFPVHSPKIERLEIAARGDVRRAKLYYLRDRVGRAARVAERRWGVAEELIAAEPVAVDAEGESIDEADVVEAPPEQQEDAGDEEAAAEQAAEGEPEQESEGESEQEPESEQDEDTQAGEDAGGEPDQPGADDSGAEEPEEQADEPSGAEASP